MQGAVQRWLGEYQETAVEYAQQGYDQISEYVKGNFNDYVEANNLTQVTYPTIQPKTWRFSLTLCLFLLASYAATPCAIQRISALLSFRTSYHSHFLTCAHSSQPVCINVAKNTCFHAATKMALQV